jgi:hypothetical protein
MKYLPPDSQKDIYVLLLKKWHGSGQYVREMMKRHQEVLGRGIGQP